MVEDCPSERRRHPRIKLRPMYTSVAVAPQSSPDDELSGHAYDICEGGVRIELDQALETGTSARVRLALPGVHDEIRVAADVVWINDPHDDPGPRRMALRFSDFHSAEDWWRLHDYVAQGLRAAA